MRKTIAILFVLLFAAFSTRLPLQLHFCEGSLFDFGLEGQLKACPCGEEEADDCCSNTRIVCSIANDFEQNTHDYLPTLNFSTKLFLAVSTYDLPFWVFSSKNVQKIFPSDSSPPQTRIIWIQIRSLRC